MASGTESKLFFSWARISVLSASAIVLFGTLLFTGCGDLDRPASSPYFAEVVTPPAKKEFRWSNGRLPKSFDPAMAAAAPETDVVRAIFEGLTSTDPRTLDAVPTVAEKWTSSDNGRIWSFELRREAVWSNGKPVKAGDFVRAWNRLAALGDKAAHPELLRNFARLKRSDLAKAEPKPTATPWNSEEPPPLIAKPTSTPESLTGTASVPAEPLDVKAERDVLLTIKLEVPDPDLPKLLANPIFSPVYGDGSEFVSAEPENAIVSNGAFRLALVTKETVILDKSDNYRNKGNIEIDTVRFVPAETADDALEAYRSGQVDVVTNAEFEPLALKVLSPYQDFRKITHGALNLYEFNTAKAPFSDRHVREALSIAIERERLTEGEMEGATRPALRFLPLGGQPVKELVQDVERARTLLADAGYPDGEAFPVIRLVINRNDAQQRIARAVARMWKQNLGVETEIITKETSEIQLVRRSRDFDLIRRGVVFASSDASSNLSTIFSPPEVFSGFAGHLQMQASSNATSPTRSPNGEIKPSATSESTTPIRIPSESEALYDLTAIPLYFPGSYSLVKPYIQGFEPNGLDILQLQRVKIDSNWQPKHAQSE